MTVDSEAIFALAAHSQNDPRALEALARLDGDRLARPARARRSSSPRAASAGRSGSAAAATRSSSPRRAPRSRSSREYAGVQLRMSEVRRRHASSRSGDGRVARRARFRPDRNYVEETALPAVRAPRRERPLPRSASPRSRLPPSAQLGVSVPSLATSRPCSREPLPDEELERRPRAAPRVEHPVDLPLGQERRSSWRRASAQSANFGSRPSRSASATPCVDRPLEPLLPHRHVEAGLAERVRERAERVPVERLRRQRAPCARRCRARSAAGRAPSPSVRSRPSSSSRVAKRRGTRPGGALRGVPGAEVLDHGLRMDRGLRVGGELAHRRRAPEPLGARDDLRHDLLVRVALADTGLELASSCGRSRRAPGSGASRPCQYV